MTTKAEATRAKARERNRKWAAANREKTRAANKRWRTENLEVQRERERKYRRRRYGLPVPAHSAPAVCECCGRQPNGHGVLHLDHDHSTGKFRGWLCARCNMGLWYFGDTIAGVERALAYIRRTT